MHSALILASASPRRRQLLRTWKIPFRLIPSRLHEPPPGRTPPVRYARRLALAKARAVVRQVTSGWVLGADTIVVKGRRILGKPRSVAEAERMLRTLSGSRHRVITAVALVDAATGRRRVAHATSVVTMRRLSDDERRRYARRHLDKAGAYAVQDRGDPVVTKIAGSYTNVVGLPKELVLPLVRKLLRVTPRSGRPSHS